MIDDLVLSNNVSLTPTTLFILNNFQYYNSHVNIPDLSRNRTAPFSEILKIHIYHIQLCIKVKGG